MFHEITQDQFARVLAPDEQTRLITSVEILTDIQRQAFLYAMRESTPPANDTFLPSRKMQEALAYNIHSKGSIDDDELAERLDRIAQAHTFTR